MPPKVKQMIKEQEEQKIYTEFEILGYEIQELTSYISMFNEIDGVYIYIDTRNKLYEKYDDFGENCSSLITLKEHQLLHQLFELWGWFDE